MHEPSECLTQRHVQPNFNNFFFIPDELDAPPALCQPGNPCLWGEAINVLDQFVYVTQPRENRVVVIDVKDTFNPNQVTCMEIIRCLSLIKVLLWFGYKIHVY